MSKIEIHDLNELIKQQYPISYIKKIINDTLLLSLLVKTDYPDYKEWFLTKQVPGIYDGSRNIIVAHIEDKIIGFVSLKKDIQEKKICTFYIANNFRRNKIGYLLTHRAIEWLECEKPLITIPSDKLGPYIKIAKKYDWILTDIEDGLYRNNNPEVIVNGFVNTPESEEVNQKRKSLTNIWFFYNYNKLINNLLSRKKKFLYNR